MPKIVTKSPFTPPNSVINFAVPLKIEDNTSSTLIKNSSSIKDEYTSSLATFTLSLAASHDSAYISAYFYKVPCDVLVIVKFL